MRFHCEILGYGLPRVINHARNGESKHFPQNLAMPINQALKSLNMDSESQG